MTAVMAVSFFVGSAGSARVGGPPKSEPTDPSWPQPQRTTADSLDSCLGAATFLREIFTDMM
ncbi:hypothetical protein C6361_01805 [Plantactinospora sp. BC1]|nr:hypothetical protein C6361_01805 [Plantactinospora sp. BC1]AVT38321.1 hypothetical protein C6W10_19860 [Plantactinospora sp. BB1]